MLNLAEYRKKPKMLADFLPWTALVAPGVILNKDGSFQRTARFRGPDLDSATPAELVVTTARLGDFRRGKPHCGTALSGVGFLIRSRTSSTPSAERSSRKRECISRVRTT